MYQCKTEPISGHPNIEIVKRGEAFLKKWMDECPKKLQWRPFTRVRWIDGEVEIFLDRFLPHWNRKSLIQKAPRYRLLPCVRELLDKNREKPVIMDGTREQNKWGLVGLTPRGKSFLVIVGEFTEGDYFGEFYLNTAYWWGK